MNKFERLKGVSNNAAQQASDDCAAKIQRLTNSQFDAVIEELKKGTVDKVETDKLLKEIQTATDKNKALRDIVSKSQNLCQAVVGIIGKIL